MTNLGGDARLIHSLLAGRRRFGCAALAAWGPLDVRLQIGVSYDVPEIETGLNTGENIYA